MYDSDARFSGTDVFDSIQMDGKIADTTHFNETSKARVKCATSCKCKCNPDATGQCQVTAIEEQKTPRQAERIPSQHYVSMCTST
jgi:hypothetical protein